MQTGLFAFDTHNIGDDMQSLAVLAHLGRVDRFVDRDRMAACTLDEDLACVFNSWFLIGDDLRRPCSRIRPLWHGFCAGRPEIVQGEWLDYLRDQAPIGCRDIHTADMLAHAGIATSWIGCLTLFLGSQLGMRTDCERDGVLFVDVPTVAMPYLPAELVNRATHVSTFPPPDMRCQPLERFAAAGRLLDRIARAELVVTRRLHVALPAVSVGTPVVAIPDPGISLARQRFSGFDSFVPTVYVDDLDRGMRRIDWSSVAPARIPDALHRAHRRFSERVEGRVERGECGHDRLLDAPGRSLHVINVERVVRPAAVRLRLADRVWTVRVCDWNQSSVELGIEGFPGLSKLRLTLDVQHHASDEWIPWGRLTDLVIPQEDLLPTSSHYSDLQPV